MANLTALTLARGTASGKPVLFEIGTEELPATMLAELFESSGENPLEHKLRKIFEEKRVAFEKTKVWATPRRLVFTLEGVAERQTEKENLIRLAAKEGAFNADGSPAEKLSMILKHRNASIKDLIVQEQQGKETVFLKVAETSLAAEKVLPDMFTLLVKSLGFAKNMRWDSSGLIFPRPIRSFLCFYGTKALRFKIGAIEVLPKTRIFQKANHTFHPVKNIPSYFKFLKSRGILLDQVVRRKAIESQLERTAKSLKGYLHKDGFLLNEVNYLVETPQTVTAPFDAEFLKLPPEVLTVSMARKQRIFGVLDAQGKVMPKLIGVLDGVPAAADKKAISKNYESILHAKLQDSLFFFHEDAKVPLSKKREELKGLVFLKGAGSMLERSDRLVRLVQRLKPSLGLSNEDQKALERAAYLGKADLLTQMVGEFPELQGVMGKYYAIENGEPAEAALAIGEQYLPRTVNDQLPGSAAGSFLSILDKCDLIAACFALGLEPTSSLDPYGLRRSATGIIKIILDKKFHFSLPELLERTISEQKIENPKSKDDALLQKLKAFFKDRFKAVLVDRGFGEELADAVMSTRFEDACEVFQRAEALHAIARTASFESTWRAVFRLSNILKSNKESLPEQPQPSQFTEDLERAVWARYEQSHSQILSDIKRQDYGHATNLYAEAFSDILEQFFAKVFVNAEDLNIRKNRLSMLRAVQELYTRDIADLSKIRLSNTL